MFDSHLIGTQQGDPVGFELAPIIPSTQIDHVVPVPGQDRPIWRHWQNGEKMRHARVPR